MGGERGSQWCLKCGARHAMRNPCPGELLATGAERHGWRLLVDAPNGPEVYGTLVAPAGKLWRARILTYPNVLWTIHPGVTMKFVGPSPGAVEQEAIEHILAHCSRRSLKIRSEVPAVEPDEIDLEMDETAVRPEVLRATRRLIRTVRVRYGVSRTDKEAETDDLSESGMFIRTQVPLSAGTRLRIHVETGTAGVELRGVVAWTQERSASGRPCGMGIWLTSSDDRYLEFVRSGNG